jgi:hypothetical protein
MKTKTVLFYSLLAASSQAVVILSEFEPNPAGADPDQGMVELAGGTPGAAFDYYLVSIENDGFNGTIDRSANIMGSFDGNGLAVVSVPDLENPSFTAVLIDIGGGFAVDFAIGDDLDPADDGTLTLPSSWSIVDAVGISDEAGDDGSLYGSILGGNDIFYNGQFEPLLVFREGSTGDWYQTVTIDFGGPTERVGAFAATPDGELTRLNFLGGSLAPTYGSVNPVIPEPSTALLSGFAFLGLLRRRR